MNIILCGFKNCGKTTLAKKLAKKFKKEFIDIDHLIEELYFKDKKENISFSKIYKKEGEKYFRIIERKAVLSLKNSNSIIAIGGGTLLDEDNFLFLKNFGFIIYLKVSKEILKERYLLNPSVFANRDNLSKAFEEHYKRMEEIYKKAADYTVG